MRCPCSRQLYPTSNPGSPPSHPRPADIYLDTYRLPPYIRLGKVQERAIPTATAKLFTTGRSQAVRLPLEFRFPGTEVYIRRDPTSGDVILSSRPASWDGLFELYVQSPIPADFMGEADRAQPPQDRDPFEAWPSEGHEV
jgi:antitoxin VapB